MKYEVREAPGWHNKVNDPVIFTTEDEAEASMWAGMRIDLIMPGNCNSYCHYAVDEDGNEVERIESFRCDECGELVEWGEHGPVGTKDGEILECPRAMEKHLVTWVCEDCAEKMES